MLLANFLFVGFVLVLFAGSRLLPGRIVRGAVPADGGSPPEYRLNGQALFWWCVAAMALCGWLSPRTLSWPARHWAEILVAANVFAFGVAGVLYVSGLRGRPPEELRAGVRGRVRGYFYGVRLNPVWAGVDLKFFSYRPSLIGLLVLNASTAATQYVDQGSVSGRMTLYQVFFFLYLANYFQFEGGMVHTWDIVVERFGWSLVWGDFVLVPFFYGISGRSIAILREPLPLRLAVVCCVLFSFGFWLFRGANDQKHRFKENSSAKIWGRPAEALDGRLLISGFWGIGRKLNYTGELMIYISWTMLCGTASGWPYLLPAWLLVLFVHRAHRDDRRCRAKYGELWDRYCRRARFRMFPFVY